MCFKETCLFYAEFSVTEGSPGEEEAKEFSMGIV